MALWVSGDGWTGALGSADLVEEQQQQQPLSNHDEENCRLTQVQQIQGGKAMPQIVGASGGWGHSALILLLDKSPQLYICGRPQDFANLLRLRRLPAFLRNFLVKRSVQNYFKTRRAGDASSPSSLLDKLVELFVGADASSSLLETTGNNNPMTATVLPEYVSLQQLFSDQNVCPTQVVARAGVTAILTRDGNLYCMGLNTRGQCGVGKHSNNVWKPTPVVGLTSQYASEGRSKLTKPEAPILQVALGLQHGVALNANGQVFCWGKGERGQLAQDEDEPMLRNSVVPSTLPHAIPVYGFTPSDTDEKPSNQVKAIAAGLNHSAALTESNHVFVWGKNVAPATSSDVSSSSKPAMDATSPRLVPGLPKGVQVLDVACGSHHTAMLLEDGSVYGIGIATDDGTPVLEEAVELIPSSVVAPLLPLRQFTAHFDRTTLVGHDGKRVLEVQLWSHEALQHDAAFTPSWVETLLADEQAAGRPGEINRVERGWLHQMIITKD